MRTTAKIKPLITVPLYILSVSASLSLVMASIASMISPASAWIPALFGLAFPMIFIANLCFIPIWLFYRKKYLLAPVTAIIIALPTAWNFFAMNGGHNTIDSKEYKILSFNVRNFDLYNWSSNKQTRNRIFDFLKREHADIVCLQEFFNSTSKKDDFVTLDTILKFQPARNFHTEYTLTQYQSQNWGIATFSKYPIISRKRVDFDEKDNNICIYTDIKIDNDTIRVYNMHLASIHFQRSDYQFIDSIGTNNQQNHISGSVALIKKLKKAFIRRASQTEKILESIQNSPHPVLICGDFNDTPSSYAYNQMTEILNDAFLESGNGVGRTYIGSFPSFRIDYILHSEELRSRAFNTYKDVLSDHYPVSCYVSMSEKQ